jgi:hypothetical protein
MDATRRGSSCGAGVAHQLLAMTPRRRGRRRRRLCNRRGRRASLPRPEGGVASDSPKEASEFVKWSLSPVPLGEPMKGSQSGSSELALRTLAACAAAARGGSSRNAEPALRAASSSSTSSAHERREHDPGSMEGGRHDRSGRRDRSGHRRALVDIGVEVATDGWSGALSLVQAEAY